MRLGFLTERAFYLVFGLMELSAGLGYTTH